MEILTSEEVNNLRVSIDWIALTCSEEHTADTLIVELGFTDDDFQKLERGANGYRKQLKHNLHSIRILYDGNEDMGVHVIISGSAVAPALKAFIESEVDVCPIPVYGGSGVSVENFGVNEMQRFLTHLSKLGHFTRLDIAVDDLNGVGLSPEEASELVCNGQCVSRFRTCQHTKKTDFQGVNKGHTVYFGSGQSDFLVRLYDKKLEQEGKGQIVDSPVWYRWELELKKEYADRTARSIAVGTAVGSIGIGILTYYIRFINLDNSVRSRCTMHKKWENFVRDALGAKLYIAPPKKTIKNKHDWIDRQVAPSLAAVFVASGADVNTLYHYIESGWERAKKPLKRMAEYESSLPAKQTVFTDEEIEAQIAETERKELVRAYIQKEMTDPIWESEVKYKVEKIPISLDASFRYYPKKKRMKRCKKKK